MTTASFLLIDKESPAKTLREARENLSAADGELLLDFSSVRHIDAGTLKALEDLAQAAEKAEVAILLRGTDVAIYKVLKLAGLTSQLQFIN